MHRLFFVLISLIATSAFAVDVANLYQSQMPIASQSEEDRQKQAPAILEKVILKVVGDSALLTANDLSPVLAQTEQLIQQYEYKQLNVISDDVTLPDQLALRLLFNEPMLNQALSDIGLPIWSKSRPETIIWLAVDNDNKRSIIASDSDALIIVDSLNVAAQQRGVPILLPTMDLQDQAQVSFADLWGGFSESIEQASQRYGAPIVLMAKVSVSGGASQIRWQAIINGELKQWQSQGDINLAITSGIGQLADHLARQFTQVISHYDAKQQVVAEVSNVRDYADYARLMAYLNGLQYVSDVQVVTMQAEQVEISFNLQGDQAIFNQGLKLDKVLESTSTVPHLLQYRLLP